MYTIFLSIMIGENDHNGIRLTYLKFFYLSSRVLHSYTPRGLHGLNDGPYLVKVLCLESFFRLSPSTRQFVLKGGLVVDLSQSVSSSLQCRL